SIILSGILQAIYGNLQLLGYFSSNNQYFNITGSFFNPGPYAGFLVSVWVIALSVFLFMGDILKIIFVDQKKPSPNHYRLTSLAFDYISVIGMFSILLVLPSTKSRATWITFFISSIILLFYKYKVYKIIKGLRFRTKGILS